MGGLMDGPNVRLTISGAQGAVGIEIDGTPTPGEFLVKAPGGDRKYLTASGTGADDGLRTDLAADDGAANIGYGSGSAYDFLESIPRLGSDTIVSGSATLGVDAFGRIHSVTATGTITLPSPGTSLVGGVVILRVDDTCTGLVTLSGAFPYGATAMILWAGEEVVLEWTGSYFRARSPYLRRMGGKIAREAGNVALADGVYSDFLVDTPSNDRGSLDLGIAATPPYFDSTNKRVKIARTGQWRVIAYVSVNPTALVTATLTMCLNGATQNADAMVERQLASGVRQTLVCEIEGYFNTGDYIIPRVKVVGGTGTIDNGVDGFVTVLEVK
jgi:hypothetical protein